PLIASGSIVTPSPVAGYWSPGVVLPPSQAACVSAGPTATVPSSSALHDNRTDAPTAATMTTAAVVTAIMMFRPRTSLLSDTATTSYFGVRPSLRRMEPQGGFVLDRIRLGARKRARGGDGVGVPARGGGVQLSCSADRSALHRVATSTCVQRRTKAEQHQAA